MIAGWPASAASATDFTVDAYLIAVEDVETDVLGMVCRSFITGSKRDYAPNATELAERCRMMVPVPLDPNDMRDIRNLTSFPIGAPVPEGMEPAGMLTVDFGHGKIDMTRLTYAEQNETMKTQRLPERLRGPVRAKLQRIG